MRLALLAHWRRLLQGVLYGLTRHGRVLIADEMGVGKTMQALALAACYQVRAPPLSAVSARDLDVRRRMQAPPHIQESICILLSVPPPVHVFLATEHMRPLLSDVLRRRSGPCWLSCLPACAWCGRRRSSAGCLTSGPATSLS